MLSVIAVPFYWVAETPNRIARWSDEALQSRTDLQTERDRLKAEVELLREQLLKHAYLEAENVRLRELLNSSALVDDSVLVAELIGVSPNPLSHEVVLNKGKGDGVFVGQPVIDAYGLVGQITSVGQMSSRALLITDSTHAVPVQNSRTGARAVAEGTGLLTELSLPHVAATADIQVGDQLVSSGLGRRFPVGYPVAVVTAVTVDPGQPFAAVKARPNAHLDRSGHVLLVFTRRERKAPISNAPTSTADSPQTHGVDGG